MNQEKIMYLNPNDIVIDVNKNVRNENNYGEEDFQELQESIRSQGVKQPIYVFENSDGNYEVAHGFRRVLAIQFLLQQDIEVDPVPAIEVEEDSEEILLDHLILNYGKPLTQLEQSAILKELSDKGMDNKTIAEKTGIQYQKVTYLVRFRKEACKELVEAIQNDNIQFTVALQLLRDAGKEHEAQKQLLQASQNKSKLNGNSRITINDIREVIEEWQEDEEAESEKKEQEKENKDKVKKENNAESDGDVSVESETEEDEVDEDFPEQKTSNETNSDEEDDELEYEVEFDMETYMWDFTKYIESRKGEIKGSAGFFDKNQFIQTLEYIQKNIEDKSFEELFNEIFVKND